MQKKAARRGQRALAFLLCLLMVATLLPVMGASAAEGDVSATGVELNKTLTLQNDGTYAITLEAYATGTVTSTTVTEPVPTDFVLVLDQSGSMAEKITSYTYTARESQGYSYSILKNQKLYYKDGDAYYRVQRDYYTTWSRLSSTNHYYLYYEKDGTIYYLSETGTTTTRPSAYTSISDIIWTGLLYTRTGTSQTKLDALKNAVTNFVTSVQNQKDANGTPVDHRIAIVGFGSGQDEKEYEGYDKGAFNYANTELFIGSNQYNYDENGKESNQSQVASTQYGNALQRVNDSAGKQNLTDSINALAAFGGTNPNLGLEMANGIFNAYHSKNDYQYPKADGSSADRGKVVVMFTDGQPQVTTDSTQVTAANSAISQAKSTKENAKVFTIGVFSVADTTKLNSSDYTIADYMNAVSSNYPQATSLSSMGTRSTDGVNYYATASDSEALNAAFQSVSSSVNSSSTSCELDADSVLTDVISGNLDLPEEGFSPEKNVTVSTATCNGTGEDGELTWQAKTPFNATVTTDGKAVNVSGFDYSQNYVTGEANKGKKLIVKITGLLPNQSGTKLPSNKTTSGIYDDDKLVAPFEVPTFNVGLETRVVDFGMTVDIAGNVLNTNAATHLYGKFSRNGNNTYTYNLNSVKGDNGNYTFGFTGVDSALYFANARWNKVNVIPANNVYYDDDLLSSSSDFKDSDQGYDSAVNSVNYGVDNLSANTTKTLTFTGTGIDVYCTTEENSGSVYAKLRAVDAEGNVINSLVTDAAGNKVMDGSMNNTYVSNPSLINVPTLSFTGLTYGTYQLTIRTGNNENYKLDGVRIYNPANADAVAVGKESDIDVKAQFVNVREQLLSATPTELTEGAVYVDEKHETYDISVYEKDGPKNEVYLAQNQKVGFQLTGVPEGATVLVGLSAPENRGNATAKVTCGEATTTLAVNSAIDMYYPVEVSSDGYVVIENTSNVLLSVTNVQISSGDGTSSAMVMSSPELMSYMADFDALTVVDTTPAPEAPTPETPNNTISAIIHAIWAQVRDSIGKLFGRL